MSSFLKKLIGKKDATAPKKQEVREFVPKSQFDVTIETVITDFDSRLTDVIAQFSAQPSSDRKPISVSNTFALVTLYELYHELPKHGYGGLIKLFEGPYSKLALQIVTENERDPAFSSVGGLTEAFEAWRNYSLDKYTGLPKDIVYQIRDAMISSMITGTNSNKALRLIKKTLEKEKKELVELYGNTMIHDIMQICNDMTATKCGGDLYWAYNGPLDDATRPICRKLLEIGYFTDKERKEVEKETAKEREFGCRHTFDLVSKGRYEEQKAKKGSS